MCWRCSLEEVLEPSEKSPRVVAAAQQWHGMRYSVRGQAVEPGSVGLTRSAGYPGGGGAGLPEEFGKAAGALAIRTKRYDA